MRGAAPPYGVPGRVRLRPSPGKTIRRGPRTWFLGRGPHDQTAQFLMRTQLKFGSVPKVVVGPGSRGWPQAVRGTEDPLDCRHSCACYAAFLPGIGLPATTSAMILAAVLGSGALVGVRGLVDLGALDGPTDRVVAEPAAARPVLVHLREHGAHHPDERLPAWEDLHDAALRRLGSRLARSCTLLVRSLTWCS